MKYIHAVSYVREALWAILPSKMEEILAALALRASGDKLSAEEIAAIVAAAPQTGTQNGGAVAVIPLRGTIAHRMGSMADSSGGMSAERFTRMVNMAASDPAVSGIVIDVDSPGGTVNGVPEAAQAVYDARQVKPVIAQINGYGASAAYWAIAGAHEIVASPGIVDNSIGSIGIYTIHQDMAAALEKQGIKPTIISAGKFKIEGNPFEPLSEDRRAFLQASVDTTYSKFVADVARGRGVDVSAVKNGYGEGRALPAVDAKKAGMVDRIATMDATLARLSSPQVRGRIMSGQRAEEDAFDAITPYVANLDHVEVGANGITFKEPDGDTDRLRRLRFV